VLKQYTTSTYGMEVKVSAPRTLPVTSRLRPLESYIWVQCRCTTLLGVFLLRLPTTEHMVARNVWPSRLHAARIPK